MSTQDTQNLDTRQMGTEYQSPYPQYLHGHGYHGHGQHGHHDHHVHHGHHGHYVISWTHPVVWSMMPYYGGWNMPYRYDVQPVVQTEQQDDTRLFPMPYAPYWYPRPFMPYGYFGPIIRPPFFI